jgi:hypothetical protein
MLCVCVAMHVAVHCIDTVGRACWARDAGCESCGPCTQALTHPGRRQPSSDLGQRRPGCMLACTACGLVDTTASSNARAHAGSGTCLAHESGRGWSVGLSHAELVGLVAARSTAGVHAQHVADPPAPPFARSLRPEHAPVAVRGCVVRNKCCQTLPSMLKALLMAARVSRTCWDAPLQHSQAQQTPWLRARGLSTHKHAHCPHTVCSALPPPPKTSHQQAPDDDLALQRLMSLTGRHLDGSSGTAAAAPAAPAPSAAAGQAGQQQAPEQGRGGGTAAAQAGSEGDAHKVRRGVLLSGWWRRHSFTLLGCAGRSGGVLLCHCGGMLTARPQLTTTAHPQLTPTAHPSTHQHAAFGKAARHGAHLLHGWRCHQTSTRCCLLINTHWVLWHAPTGTGSRCRCCSGCAPPPQRRWCWCWRLPPGLCRPAAAAAAPAAGTDGQRRCQHLQRGQQQH